MVCGIPNVGKSSFINKLYGKGAAKTGDKPGVTRGKQWITLKSGIELLDMPGILWPKLEDKNAALNLAYTGAVKDEVLDIEELACSLCSLLAERYPDKLIERYKITEEDCALEAFEVLEAIGRKRGMKARGGDVDTERAANTLLDEYRGGKLGRLTLEFPPVPEEKG